MHKLWRCLRDLKRDFPLRHPVSVRTHEALTDSDGHRLFGCVTRGESAFRILLARGDVSVMIDTLWHEWTHALLWPRCTQRHSKAFWTQYGKIYARYQDA